MDEVSGEMLTGLERNGLVQVASFNCYFKCPPADVDLGVTSESSLGSSA